MINCAILAEISHYGILSLAQCVCVHFPVWKCYIWSMFVCLLPAHISTAELSSEADQGQLSQLHIQRENVCVW